MQALLWNDEQIWYNDELSLRKSMHSDRLAGDGVKGSLKTQVEANLPVLRQCHEEIRESLL